MTRFFVLHEAKSGNAAWDIFSGEFPTKGAAINAADDEWCHLTSAEQRNRVITACSVESGPDEDIWDAINRSGYAVIKTLE